MRHDDTHALITRAEQRAANKQGKVKQRWTGDFAVELENGDGASLALAIENGLPKSHTVGELAHGSYWVAGSTSYAAKGANADDIEKAILRIATKKEIKILEVAVNTHGVTVLPQA